MSNERDEPQNEMVQILRQMLEEARKNAAYRAEIDKSFGDRLPHTGDSIQELSHQAEELRKQSEQRLQEVMAYRSRLFATLDRLIEVLTQISTKLDKHGPSG